MQESNILTVGGSSTESYTYDAQDRLTQAVINGTTYTYTYDASGLRLTKTVLNGRRRVLLRKPENN